MFKTTHINTFVSKEDCEMFIIVLSDQWNKHLQDLPEGARIEILKDMESPNRMQAIWSYKKKEDREIIFNLGRKIILPYLKRLSPKRISYSTELIKKFE